MNTPYHEAAEALIAVRKLTRGSLGQKRGALKETEVATLEVLAERETMIVGDIQRDLEVLAAQMSRILRGMESREKPLVFCKTNPHDKRKVDVTASPDGVTAMREHTNALVRKVVVPLQERLTETEAAQLAFLLRKLATKPADPASEHAGDANGSAASTEAVPALAAL
jgi:DNA-binding MarR family transcriptional regulator